MRTARRASAEVQSLKILAGPAGGETYAPTYLLFNSILGGVRMRQERLEPVDCPRSEGLQGSVHVGKCSELVSYYLHPDPHEGMWADDSLMNTSFAPDIYFRSMLPASAIISKIRELEQVTWFSPLTSRVEIMYTTYNAHQGSLTAMYVILFINRAGHIYKDVEAVTFWIDPYHGTWYAYALDAIWLLLVFKILFEEGTDLFKHCKQLGCLHGLNAYLDIYNVVDWFNIFVSLLIVLMWLLQLGRLESLYTLMQKADVDVPGSWTDEADLADFFDKVHVIAKNAYNFRVIVAMYQFLIASRFFEAFDVQPRLSLVTRTVSTAMVSIIHFGVVFLTIFSIFVVSGMILFGQEVEQFTNMSRAMHTTFRVLLGDFDWDSLAVVGRAQSVVWFWMLMWLMNLIMLNMFLGIILDTYSDVKNQIMSQPGVETMWSQVIETYSRKRKVASGEAFSLSYIIKVLDPTDLDSAADPTDDNKITVGALMRMVPGLGEEQAENILLTALDYYGEDTVEASEVEVLSDKLDKVYHDLNAKLLDLHARELRRYTQDDGGVTQVTTHVDANDTESFYVSPYFC